MTNKLGKKIIYILIKLSEKKIIYIKDKTFLKMKYFYIFDKKLDLANPITLNEKLQWLKLYDRRNIYTTMVDKSEVKKYISNMIGKEYIIPTLGVYDSFEEIDFDKLPKQFVIKCTHNSGGVIVVKDKEKLEIKKVKKEIEKNLKSNFYLFAREWPYKNVKHRIIIEKYMENENGSSIEDYKFQTFNGKLAYSFVCTDRENNDVKYTFFDKNKNIINVTQCGKPNDPKNAKLPLNYDKMVKLAEYLAKDLLEIRVDFYEINKKIYFGELTFFDSGGFGKFTPEDWDFKFGEMLKLKLENNDEK